MFRRERADVLRDAVDSGGGAVTVDSSSFSVGVFEKASETAKFGQHREVGFRGYSPTEETFAPKRGQREPGDL
jgi:hypothetical protein